MAAHDTVTLRLDGDVRLSDLARIVTAFRQLMDGLSGSMTRKHDVEWLVTELHASAAASRADSFASATVRGVASAAVVNPVHKIVRAFLDVGRALERHSLGALPPRIAKPAERMAAVLNGHVRSVVFENFEGDVQVASGSVPEEVLYTEDFGAVEGRVQTLMSHGGLRFTLFDLESDRAVSCYLRQGSDEQMRERWGKIAVVEGLVKRNAATGRPLVVRDVTDVVPMPEPVDGGFRVADSAGAGARSRMSAADAIRKIRGA